MIKTHKHTGLKYLCVTTRKEYHKYSGSGVEWKKHLKENGRAWNTELIFESDNINDFSRVCLEKSIFYDIVNSKDWANITLENGGGEYPVNENGDRILRSSKIGFASLEEMEEFCKTANWFECSVCGARMTENAFAGFKAHKKCKDNPEFKMIPMRK